VEGVAGYGERFMLGVQAPGSVPAAVTADVRRIAGRAAAELGPVRLEWVHDGTRAWVVQLHVAEGLGSSVVIYPGKAGSWRQFDPSEGLDVLRALIEAVRRTGEGVEVTRPVGLSSHVGDLLRRARIPARLAV